MNVTQLTPTGRARRRTNQPLNRRVDPVFAQIWHITRSRSMSQRGLAEAAGLSHSTISLLLAGTHSPNTYTLGRLAEGVGHRVVLVPADTVGEVAA